MNPELGRRRGAVALALTAVLLWSTVATAFKFALQNLDPVQLVFQASLVSLVFFTAVAAVRGRLERILRSPFRIYLRSAGLGLLNPLAYYLLLRARAGA